MTKRSTTQIIPAIQECLTRQERPDSDIDLLVEYDPSSKISLMTISRVMCELKKATGKQVDVIEEGRLMPFAVESANRDKILIYERANQR